MNLWSKRRPHCHAHLLDVPALGLEPVRPCNAPAVCSAEGELHVVERRRRREMRLVTLAPVTLAHIAPGLVAPDWRVPRACTSLVAAGGGLMSVGCAGHVDLPAYSSGPGGTPSAQARRPDP
jgi:hypothetical protein